ncbi:MAG: NAD(P)-dependent oxidoreductase [Deltaproteobacteria bacterium]|nr:NAD(P)-dependent oxidoreductase [Deltaproteobacteria bacterium]
MSDLADKTIFITGASRGIGLAIAKRCAAAGANIVIAAKTDKPHPKLPGTIHTAAQEIVEAGGRALPCVCDIRFEDQIQNAVEKAAATFGGIDAVVNNASAIFLAGTAETPMKRFDLMHQINARGTYAVTQACLPYLEKSDNAHVVVLSPPLNMEPRWFAGHVAYTISKYGMSMCVLGMAEEFKDKGIAVNALWPKTVIATAAVQNVLGGDDMIRRSRKPEIMGEAGYRLLRRPSRDCTGRFLLDEDVLREEGVTDFSEYAVDPSAELIPDYFI